MASESRVGGVWEACSSFWEALRLGIGDGVLCGSRSEVGDLRTGKGKVLSVSGMAHKSLNSVLRIGVDNLFFYSM